MQFKNYSQLWVFRWLEGHPACKKTEWWGAGVVICLEWGAYLHMASEMTYTVSGGALNSTQTKPNQAYGPADATATHCLLLQ